MRLIPNGFPHLPLDRIAIFWAAWPLPTSLGKRQQGRLHRVAVDRSSTEQQRRSRSGSGRRAVGRAQACRGRACRGSVPGELLRCVRTVPERGIHMYVPCTTVQFVVHALYEQLPLPTWTRQIALRPRILNQMRPKHTQTHTHRPHTQRTLYPIVGLCFPVSGCVRLSLLLHVWRCSSPSLVPTLERG